MWLLYLFTNFFVLTTYFGLSEEITMGSPTLTPIDFNNTDLLNMTDYDDIDEDFLLSYHKKKDDKHHKHHKKHKGHSYDYLCPEYDTSYYEEDENNNLPENQNHPSNNANGVTTNNDIEYNKPSSHENHDSHEVNQDYGSYGGNYGGYGGYGNPGNSGSSGSSGSSESTEQKIRCYCLDVATKHRTTKKLHKSKFKHCMHKEYGKYMNNVASRYGYVVLDLFNSSFDNETNSSSNDANLFDSLDSMEDHGRGHQVGFNFFAISLLLVGIISFIASIVWCVKHGYKSMRLKGYESINKNQQSNFDTFTTNNTV